MGKLTAEEYRKLRQRWDYVLPPAVVTPLSPRSLQQEQDWGHARMNVEALWDNSRGEDAIIFIIDTAGETQHPDLEPATNPKAYCINFTVEKDWADKNGHGTHVAGIAAGRDNSFGIVGVAPDARLAFAKVLQGEQGTGAFAWVAAAIRWAADLELLPQDKHRKKILNLSLGGPYSIEVYQAIQHAIRRGCIVVAAAGNSGYQEGENTVDFPGGHDEVITVASISKNDFPSWFSSSGPAVDVAAPGDDVYSTHLDDGYARISGTSMATPYISGFIALLAGLYPELWTEPKNAQAEVERFLRENATDLLAPGHDPRTGAGLPEGQNYTHENEPEPQPDKPGCWAKFWPFRKK